MKIEEEEDMSSFALNVLCLQIKPFIYTGNTL